MKHLGSSLLITAVFTFILLSSYPITDFSVTGFAVYQEPQGDTYTADTIELWQPTQGDRLTFFAVSGQATGYGTVEMYLLDGRDQYLVHQLSVDGGEVFRDACAQSCNLPNLNAEKYLIRYVVPAGVSYTVDEITYGEGSTGNVTLEETTYEVEGSSFGETTTSSSTFNEGVSSAVAPVVSEVNLTATDAPLNSFNANLTGSVSASDGDGHDISNVYNWYKDGSLNATNVFIDNADLIAYYPFNDDVYDYAGTYDGTNNGATLTANGGIIGGAYDFDGTNDYLDVGAVQSGDWTISVWINTDDSVPVIQYPMGVQAARGVFVEYDAESDGWGFYDGSTTLTGSNLNENQWYNLGVTKVASSGAYVLYVNGIEDTSGSLINIDINDLDIGRRADNNFYYDGSLDELQIYNRTLTASEISQLYYGSVYGGSVMNASQTTVGDVWTLGVVGCDSTACSSETNSSSITILANHEITVSNVNVVATDDPLNRTTANVTVTFDTNDTLDHNLSYVYNWYKDGSLNATSVFIDDPDLMVYLPFDNDFNDYANDYDFTTIGTPTFSSNAIMNRSMSLDGSTDSIYNDDYDVKTTFADSFTVGIWANPDTYASGNHEYVVSKEHTSHVSPYYLFNIRWLQTSNAFKANLWRSDTYNTYLNPSSGPVATLGEWVYLVASYDSDSSNLTFYIDGSLNSFDDTPTGSYSHSFASTELSIGRNANLGAAQHFDGYLDEFQLYNRSMSASEVSQLYFGSAFGGNVINASQTTKGDVWTLGVTACDSTTCSNETNSSSITILNTPPTVDSVTLNATSTSNLTSDNLTLTIGSVTDADGDSVKNITDWQLYDGSDWNSITVLNMPMENISVSPGTVKDYSTWSNNGTNNGATLVSTGGFDGKGAYEFDGSDTISISDSDELSFGDGSSDKPFSVFMWVKPDSVNSRMLISKRDDSTNQKEWDFQFNSANDLVVILHDESTGATLTKSDTNTLSTGVWYFIGFTYDGSGTASGLHSYVDAVIVDDSDDSSGSYTAMENTGSAVLIGAYNPTAPAYYFDGIIDEVRVFNRSLSTEQIAALYDNQTNLIVSNETEAGDIWRASVTPNDGNVDGITVYSNNITIVGATSNPSSLNVSFTAPTVNATSDANGYFDVNISIANANTLEEVNYTFDDIIYNLYDDDLTLYLSFDRYSNLSDQSLYGTNATNVGSTHEAAKHNYGYTMDGGSAYMTIPSNQYTNFGTNDAFTISFWANQGAGNAAHDALIEKWSGSGGYSYVFRYGGTEGVSFARYDGSNNPSVFSGNLDTDWHHYVAFRNATSDTIGFYVDGVYVAESSDTTTGSVGSSTNYLGRRGGGANPWAGTLDEIKMWNKTLTAKEAYIDYVSNLAQINATQWYLSVNQSLNGTTTLPKGTYTYSACASDTDEINCTGTYQYTVLNTAPTIDSVILNATSTSNTSNDNLTGYVTSSDADNDEVKDIIDWREWDGGSMTSIAVLNMPFENTSTPSSVAKDYSTYENNGTVSTAEFNNTGGYDGRGAYYFDGTTDSYINIGSAFADLSESAGTVMMWINPTVELNDSIQSTFFSQWHRYNLKYETLGRLHLRTDNDYIYYPINFSANEWVHIAGTFDYSTTPKTQKLFVNGVNVANNTPTGTDANFFSTTLYLGVRYDNNGFQQGFNGGMNSVKVYDRALSVEQVAAIYAAEVANTSDTIMVAEELNQSDIWQACATPNDGNVDGSEVCSNNMTINSAATINVSINLTEGTALNYTTNTTLVTVTATGSANECTVTLDGNGLNTVGSNTTSLGTVTTSTDTNFTLNLTDVNNIFEESYNITASVSCTGASDSVNETLRVEHTWALQTDFIDTTELIGGSLGFDVGDYVRFTLEVRRNGDLFNLSGDYLLQYNLTTSGMTVLKTQNQTQFTRVGDGLYYGKIRYLSSYHTLACADDPTGCPIRSDAALNAIGERLASDTHGDQHTNESVGLSISSNNYNFTVVNESVYTVINLTVNDSYTLINWTGSELDLSDSNPLDLDVVTSLGQGAAYVNSTAAPGLNRSTYTYEDYVVTIRMDDVDCDNEYLFYADYTNKNDIITNGVSCDSTQCEDYACSSGTLTFSPVSFSGYAFGLNANLTIYDANDTEGGSNTLYTDEQIPFYANYTNATGGAAISAGSCTIEFNDTGLSTGMTYNATSALFEHNRTYSSGGTYTWNVTCSGTGFSTLNTTDTIVVNAGTQPVLNITIQEPLTDINATNGTAFNVTANVTCTQADCGTVEVSLDPITGCDPEAEVCTSACNEIFEDDVPNWGFEVNYCIDTDVTIYFVNDDSACDLLLPAGTGDCGTFNSNGVDYYTCPSYERNNNVSVTSDDCVCDDQGESCVLTFDSIYNFSSAFFMGSESSLSAKGGLIPNGTGNPFYTTSGNPRNITLTQGQSQLVTWLVYPNGTPENSYEFFVYANVTSNYSNSNVSSTWNVTIVQGDLVAPNVTNLLPSVATQYNTTNTIQIAANVTDDVSVDTVRANISYSGNSSIIVLTLSTGSKYNGSYTVPSTLGRYNVTILSNDTSGNANNSETTYFTVVNPATVGIIITEPLTDLNERNQTPFNVTANVTCSDGNCGTIEVSLDPLQNCDPSAAQCSGCSDAFNQTLYESSQPNGADSQPFYLKAGNVDGWCTFAPVADYCKSLDNSTDEFSTSHFGVFQDEDCDWFFSDGANGQCLGYWEVNGDEVYCPSYERNGNVTVTADDCIVVTCVDNLPFPVSTIPDLESSFFTSAVSTKGGLIPNGTGNPFYTTSGNPRNITLNEDESELVTWLVYPNGTIANTYEFFVFANLTSNYSKSNVSSNWNVTIVADNPPNVTNLRPTAGSSYANGTTIEIAANVTDDVSVDTVRANISYSGGSSITVLTLSTGSKYNGSYTIPATLGRYNVTILSNDSVGNSNNTVTTYFTANDTLAPSLTSNGCSPDPVNYTNATNCTATITDQVGIGQVVANVTFSNGTVQAQTVSNVSSTYYFIFNDTENLGQYNITWRVNDTSNNRNTTTDSFTVSNLSDVEVPPVDPPSGGCDPDWECTEWSDVCVDGERTRTCEDKEDCGIESSMPSTTLACECNEASDCGTDRYVNNPSCSTSGDVIQRYETFACEDFECSSTFQTVTKEVCSGSTDYCASGSCVECVDDNDCGLGERCNSNNECTVEECISSWDCGDWSTCEDSLTTRVCQDTNGCISGSTTELAACEECYDCVDPIIVAEDDESSFVDVPCVDSEVIRSITRTIVPEDLELQSQEYEAFSPTDLWQGLTRTFTQRQIIVDPFALECNSNADTEMTVVVPFGYKNYDVQLCRNGVCDSVTAVNVTSLTCQDGVFKANARLESVFVPSYSSVDIVDSDLAIRKQIDISSRVVDISMDDATGKQLTIEPVLYEIDQPPNPGITLFGVPSRLITRDVLSSGANITYVYDDQDFIEETSTQLLVYDGSWRVIQSDVNTTTNTLTARVENLSEFVAKDEEVIFALGANYCSRCGETYLERVYNSDKSDVALILIHGFDSNPGSFQSLINDISLTQQAVDVWVFGYPQNVTLARSIDAYDVLMEDYMENYSNVVIVGHSLGGIVAQGALQQASETNRTYKEKVSTLVLLGSPQEGFPLIKGFDNIFSNIVNVQTISKLFNVESESLRDLDNFTNLNKIEGIDYQVVAGTLPYVFEVGDVSIRSDNILNLANINDGLFTAKSVRTFGDEEIGDLCKNYFEVNLTHTELNDASLARRLIGDIVAREIGNEISSLGATQYVKVKVPGCQTGDVLVVTGVPKGPADLSPIEACILGEDAFKVNACFDGRQNSWERGVDCGGPCVACAKDYLFALLFVITLLITLYYYLKDEIKRAYHRFYLNYKEKRRFKST